jgi:hypothetical protein
MTTVRVERGSGGLGGRSVEDGGDMCRVAGDTYGVRYSRWFGGLGLKIIGGRFHGFGPQNSGGGFEEERTHVMTSKSSRRGEAIS